MKALLLKAVSGQPVLEVTFWGVIAENAKLVMIGLLMVVLGVLLCVYLLLRKRNFSLRGQRENGTFVEVTLEEKGATPPKPGRSGGKPASSGGKKPPPRPKGSKKRYPKPPK